MARSTAVKESPAEKLSRFIEESSAFLHGASYDDALSFYKWLLYDSGWGDDAIAGIGKADRFFLLTHIMNRQDALNEWIYDRCREVEADPDGHLDVWAREHYKSTIITYAGCIQEILRDPDITIGLFSHTRPIAKGFLRQIKQEFEINERLKALYSDVLYAEPSKQSPKWSEDEGIVVKRKSNPKEATVEAWGLVDGQPTSKHFKLMVYDDVVTEDSVTTPDMIKKVTDRWALSSNLAAGDDARTWTIGTRYHKADTYRAMLDRGVVKLRMYPATDDGTETGTPVLVTPEYLKLKRKKMGPYIFAAQMLQDPTADKAQGFKEDWLQYWPAELWQSLNRYIICDPAGGKKKENDYTAFWVIGLGPDRNYYCIAAIRDRLNLTERTDILFRLHQRYKPLKVGYERYGKDSDIEHIEYVQELKNYRFPIVALGQGNESKKKQAKGHGKLKKEDRIRTLIPVYEQRRMYLPESYRRLNYENQQEDMVKVFINEEYLDFPVCAHDDMFDCQARIMDPALGVEWPAEIEMSETPEWMRSIGQNKGGSWMSR